MVNKKIITIMGSSGVGKTTFGDNLSLKQGIYIPWYCTTRKRRSDDNGRIMGFI